MTTTSVTRPAPSGAPTPADRRLARRQVAIFLGTTFTLLAVSTCIGKALGVDVSQIQDAPPAGQAAMYGQALWPSVGAVVALLATRRSLRNAGWGLRRTSWRSVGIGWLFAVVVGLTAPAVLWGSGLAGFDSTGFGLHLALSLLVLPLPYCVLALAEDLGWRGVLVPRLAELGGPRLVVLGGGLAWAVFHWPLILFHGGAPDGAPRLWALAMFTIGAVALGAVLAWMWLRWGQWPGIVAHATINAIGYHLVAPATVHREHTGWFATESGLGAAVVLVLAAVVWLRFAPLRRVNGRTVALVRTEGCVDDQVVRTSEARDDWGAGRVRRGASEARDE